MLVGSTAPDFTAPALVGRDFRSVALRDWLDQGKWVVLFFYPKDYSAICPTELVRFNECAPEFERRNAAIVGASTDTITTHLGWVTTDDRLKDLRYPLIGDVTHRLARDYEVLYDDQGVALRATYVIDPAGRVRWLSVYDLDTGRNVREVLRVLEALQTGGMCACEWRPGQALLAE